VTTFPGSNYALVSGTSFAAALMSGGVSELLLPVTGTPPGSAQIPQSLNPYNVLQSFASAGMLNNTLGGYGVINLQAAARQAMNYQKH